MEKVCGVLVITMLRMLLFLVLIIVYDFSVNYNQGRYHWGGAGRGGGSVPPNNFVITRGPAFSGNICIANSAYSLSTIII